MSLGELLIIVTGLSMDALAISICKGFSVGKVQPKHIIITGLWFGGSQAFLSLVGYVFGTRVWSLIEQANHWIAFVLLALISIRMIKESFDPARALDTSFSFESMFPLAIDYGIDTLAAGVSFSFLGVPIVQTVCLIGVTTFLFAAFGLWVGSRFGDNYYSKVKLAGGLIIIIIMDVKLMLEYLDILA